METDDSSSNSSASSNSSFNGPASPAQEPANESNDQAPPENVERRSGSSSRDSGSFQKQEATSQSMSSPIREPSVANENQSKDDDEEIELSDIDEESSKPKQNDISHEDLSDISDLESNSPSQNFTDLRQKLDKQRLNGSNVEGVEKSNDEDELDFEDDEVREVSENPKKATEAIKAPSEKSAKEEGEQKSDNELESGEELEDGEVTDGDDKRPEESEPKAVCRFFTRGQCTWGMSCRFLHPGTTDKGNYTMFDMVRPIPVPQSAPIIPPVAYDYRNERPPIHHMPPHAAYGHPRIPPIGESESAWERGLRTAKEMMRKANKRKEQDIDFDEKKMNLSGPPDEIEKDPYYVRGSPEATPPYERVQRERPRFEYSPPPKYARGAPGHFEEDPYGRVPRYRELPAHRMPHYEDDDLSKRRMVRSNREVIVEKADEWSDPWARKSTRRGGSPGRENRGRGRERSYSSNSSYSSSSASSRSRSSSESSGSPSAVRRKKFNNASKERVVSRKTTKARSRSTSLKRRHSPGARSRVLDKKAISPVSLKRKKPISPAPIRQDRKAHKKRDSSSGSGSSSGSESGSESNSSSTSDSKGRKKREKIVVERKQSTKAEAVKKRVSPTKDDKKEKLSDKAAAAKSTRREELLKQLKAVEDAIARKKSKI